MTAFFDQILGDPDRDRYSRPMLVPAGMPGGAKAPYTRASAFADRVKDKAHIHTWEKRYLAKTMSQPGQQDLRDLAAGEPYVSSKLTDDVAANRVSGRNLDKIIERALDRVGIHYLADKGTAIHSFCEDRGRLYEVPKHLQGHVKGYWDALDRHGIRLGPVEIFIANDYVMAAGTFDSIVWHPIHGWVIADIKTGDLDPGYVVQTSIYANGEVYDTETDQRHPLESLTGGEEVNRSVGLIFDVKPDGTRIYEVDLVKGWELTKAIKLVMDDLRMDLFTETLPPTLKQRIVACTSTDQLRSLWEANKAAWTDDLNAAAAARTKEIS